MPTTVQFRRGTTTQHSSFTGSNGEITVDIDKKTLIVHDGSTVGGQPLEKELTADRITEVLGYVPQNSSVAISNVNLNNLNDVSYSNPQTGQALIWDGSQFTLDTPFNSDAFIIELAQVTTDNLPESTSRKYLTLSNLKSELGNATTTDLPEGTNLYFTNTRVQEYLTLNDYTTISDLTNLQNNLINNAPVQLNTLGELADAINNDASFYVTITNALNSKANTADLADVATSGSTNDLTEGSNLFYTDARARNTLSAGTGITYNNGQFSIGQDVATTATVNFNSVVATTVFSDVTGDLTGNVTGQLTGNASTATKLASARSIDITGDIIASGVPFDGTANVTLNAVILPRTVELGVQTTGQYASEIGVSGVGLSATAANPDDGTAYLISLNSTSDNNNNTVVSRDASGNFSASNITSNLVGNVTGNVTGNLTGDSAGTHTGAVIGDVTGDVTGNLTGNVTGDVTGNVTGQVSNISNHTTDNLTEGTTNKYFTTANIDSTIVGGSGVTVNSGAISIGQDVAPSANPTFAGLTINGNLTVTGATTVLESNQISVGDNIIELNADLPEDQSPSQDAGIIINRGSEDDVRLVWDETNDRFTVDTNTFVASQFIGDLTGQVSDISNHTTDDLTEGTTNRYLTTTNFNTILAQKTTSDLTEDPFATPTTATQFFTQDRARAAISVSGYGTYNSNTGVITISGPVTTVNGYNGAVNLTADDIPNGATNRYFTESNFSSFFQTKRTSDLLEEDNLYFTQQRAREAISVQGSGSYDSINGIITIAGNVTTVNGKEGTVLLTTADIPEDSTSPNNRLYYTEERFQASLQGVFDSKTTDDFPAGINPTRQYFSNDLARDAFTFNGPQVIYDQETGDVTINSNVTSVNGETGEVVLSTDDVSEGVLDLASGGNKYFTNQRAREAISVTGAGGTYDQLTGVINITGAVSSVNGETGDVILRTTDISEDPDNPGDNLFFTEQRVRNILEQQGAEYATHVFVTNRLGANLDLSQVTTDSLPETLISYADGGNKYYDHALARQAISLHPDTDGATYDSNTGVLLVTGAVSSVNTKTGDVTLTTADISEDPTSLYFTNDRVGSYLTSIGIDGGTEGQAIISDGNGAFTVRNLSLTKVSESEPTPAIEGELWFDSNDGILKIYYDNFWVAINDFVFNVTQEDVLAAIGYEPNIVVQEPIVKAVQNGYLNLIGTVDFNWNQDQVFYIDGLDGDITVNITNVPGSSSPIQIEVQFMISQKETAYIPEALQINGIVKQIKWVGGSQPTGNNSNVDLFTFTMLYDGSDWIQVLGKLESYS